MSPYLFFQNLILKFSVFDKISKHILYNNTSPKYRAKRLLSSASFFLLTKITVHDLKPFRKRASLLVISCCDKILDDLFWQFVENWHLFLE